MDIKMKTVTLQYDNDNRVGVITLNRPEVNNALNETVILELTQVLSELNTKNNKAEIICLKSQGKHFCAGADLEWILNTHDFKLLQNLLHTLKTNAKITVAMIHGAVYGGGIGLISVCDVVLADPDTTFCFPEVKLGLIPALISPYVIPLIGERQAKHYFLTGEVFDAQRAKEINLITEIYNNQDSNNYIKMLLNNSFIARNNIKKLFLEPSPKINTINLEKLLVDSRESVEAQIKIKAFLNNRRK